MKTITVALLSAFLFITGCASSSTQYYEAVQRAAEANAKAAQAKFDALSAIASAGDGQAASAAVMALALTQTPSVTPVPQQSEAIQWASILASPVTSLGMMWMQADSAKAMSKNNMVVDLARVKAESADNQALYGSFVETAGVTGNVAVTGLTTMGTALGNVDYTPFIDGMVTLGTAGLDSTVDVANAGFNANTAIATEGLNTAETVSWYGFTATQNVATTGMDNLVGLGDIAIGAVENVGIQGMVGIHDTTVNWLNYSNDKDNIIKDMLANSGCTITTDADGKLVVTCN